MVFIDSLPYGIEIEKAKKLLHSHENDFLPRNVVKIIEFCISKRMGFILSRNVKVFSCRDARSNRYRLGHVGIPLYDELKSIIFKGHDYEGKEIVIIAHCRGHMQIDENKIASVYALNGLPKIMTEDEIKQRFEMDYGTVNPILAEINSESAIMNVFDIGLTAPISLCPGTMMTNAGDHTWGIEFDPSLLTRIINFSVVENIAINDDKISFFDLPKYANPKSIGIITGNSPDSGITLWNMINNNFVDLLGNRFLGDISLPKVKIVSLPAMGLSMELDKRCSSTLNVIEEAIDSLDGVDIIVLACHTTHYYTENIRQRVKNKSTVFISMTETLIEYVERMDLENVALLGIDFVADLEEYSTYKIFKKINVETVPSKVSDGFQKIAYEVKKRKKIHSSFQKFTNLLGNYISSKNIIIALTELSILYQNFKKPRESSKNIIDSLEVYADKIARCSLRLEESYDENL